MFVNFLSLLVFGVAVFCRLCFILFSVYLQGFYVVLVVVGEFFATFVHMSFSQAKLMDRRATNTVSLKAQPML